MMARQRVEYGRGSRGQWGRALWQVAAVLLLLAVILGEGPRVFRRYPLETLIVAGIVGIAALGIVLYIWELVVVGWVVDFLTAIGMPKIRITARLQYQQIGEIIVVTLRDDVATVLQCQAVQKQLKRMVDEHYCDFILDFCQAGSVSTSLRGVMLSLAKAARREAERLGKTYFPPELPRGEAFTIFNDRQSALATMSQHGGHGWVVLCSVPTGIRAVG
jgi:hypothetical protein